MQFCVEAEFCAAAGLCVELELCAKSKFCAEFKLRAELEFSAELDFFAKFCALKFFNPKLCGALAEAGSFTRVSVKFFFERRVWAAARLFAGLKFGSFTALTRLSELALFAPLRMKFSAKFNIKFRLKFLAEFSQGFIAETFAEFKALFSTQLGICADFKFSARAAEFKADFLSRFLTRGAD